MNLQSSRICTLFVFLFWPLASWTSITSSMDCSIKCNLLRRSGTVPPLASGRLTEQYLLKTIVHSDTLEKHWWPRELRKVTTPPWRCSYPPLLRAHPSGPSSSASIQLLFPQRGKTLSYNQMIISRRRTFNRKSCLRRYDDVSDQSVREIEGKVARSDSMRNVSFSEISDILIWKNIQRNYISGSPRNTSH